MPGTELGQERRDEYTAIALRQSERLKQMVEDLFELAQLEAKDTEPACEPMVIAELVQDVVQKFQLPAKQAGVDLVWEASTEQYFVEADFALTERVLNNLISNALAHSQAEGEIRIQIDKESSNVRVSVGDDGKGIPAEDLPYIFDPFYRNKSGKSVSGHAGLGLAIAHRMVELQGGTIHAENKSSGGALFSFTLPLVES
jgi:signal transduction histidine kinase